MPPKRRNSLVVKEEPKIANNPVKVETTNNEESENTNKRARRTRAVSGTSTAASTTSEQITVVTHTDLDLYLQDLFHVVCTHKDATSPRLLSVVFYLLPSQKDLPEYYEKIQNPIDLKTIAKKIKSSSYKNLKELEADLLLMTDNARRYNSPRSLISKDAVVLKRLIADTSKSLNKFMQEGKARELEASERQAKKKLLDQLASMTPTEFEKRLAEADRLALSSLNGEGDGNEENEETEPAESKKRIKKEKKSNTSTTETEMEVDEEVDEEEDEEIDTSTLRGKRNHPLILAMWSLVDFLREMKSDSNQTLIDPFVKLPSKRTYPDYYQEIKHPISLNMIKSKLNKRIYTSLNDLNRDFTLLFTNAMTYNQDDSVIYNHAKQLFEAFMQKSAELAMTDAGDLVYIKHGEENENGTCLKTATLTPNKKKTSLINDAKSGITPPKKSIDFNVLPKLNDLREKLQYLYTYVSDFQLDGRELAHPFRLLPSKIEYPDYYNIIKKPIDMNKILHRLNQVGKSTDYTSIDEICSDFAQMFENACTYNEPESTIYKDALTLQRALFNKRDEIYKQEMEYLKLENNQNYIEQLPLSFIENSVQDIIKQLFESCMSHRDAEGRIYADTFLQLYSMIERGGEGQSLDLVTLEYMRKRVNARVYKRMDVFQEEMFLFFNQIRMLSYIDGDYKIKKEVNIETTAESRFKKIHRYSQLYRDTYEMQKFFILKRDELCNNSELLQSPAFNFKVHGLDAHLSMTIGGTTFDEGEALLVDKRFKALEAKLNKDPALKQEAIVSNLTVGSFFYINKRMLMTNLEPKPNEMLASSSQDKESFIACVLASNVDKTKFIVQVYLKADQVALFLSENSCDLIKMRKFFGKEVFKSDLYALIDIKNPYASCDKPNANTSSSEIMFKQCFVIGVKEYFQNIIKIVCKTNARPMSNLEDDLYICESMLSTVHNYFRKISYKKWEPLKFLGSNEEDSEGRDLNQLRLEFTRRPEPDNKNDTKDENKTVLLERRFLDVSQVYALIDKIENNLDKYKGLPSFFKKSYCNTVQYDTPPARFKEEKEPDEILTHVVEQNQNSIEEDVELMKTAKYYEQLVLNDTEIYKIGDHVYINNSSRLVRLKSKNPLIVRIDRLWSIDTNDQNGLAVKKYYLRGPLFLRPSDIDHELTRLFYGNEVFREQTREITVSLDQIVSGTSSGSKKCAVLSHKKFVSSRITEIDERDVYLCEAKYSLPLKTFRKFTKGMRKFELSVKCLEDEIYFLRKELQLRKQLSPILSNLNIQYEDDDYSENENTIQTHETKIKGEILNEMKNENQNSNGASSIYNEKNKMHDDFDDDDESNSQDYNDDSNMMDTTGYQPSPNISKTIKPFNQSINISFKGQVIGKKIRQKRDRKSGYNIFSRDYRKTLRDTNSSLRFELMSKEVGYRWRELTDEQRAAYEEKARVESLKEMERVAAEREAQIAAQAKATAQETQVNAQKNNVASPIMNNQLTSIQQTSINGNMPTQVYIINAPIQQQQSNTQYIMLQPQSSPLVIQKQLPPQQAQHKEAYIKYIANIRKQQQMSLQPITYQTNTMYNSVNVGSLPPLVSDCNKSLDVRVNNIKENKIMPPPISWIENCPPDDVVKHLASLRYYMLNDAINVKKSEDYELSVMDEDGEKENGRASSREPVYCQL